MPSNVSDTVGVKYDVSELNNVAGAAIGGIVDVMNSGRGYGPGGEGFQGTLSAMGRMATGIIDSAGGAEGAVNYMTRQLASQAAGILGANITPAQLLQDQLVKY